MNGKLPALRFALIRSVGRIAGGARRAGAERSKTSDQSPLHPVYAAIKPTIFDAMSGLPRELGAFNLGQGLPEDHGSTEVITAVAARGLRKMRQPLQVLCGMGRSALKQP